MSRQSRIRYNGPWMIIAIIKPSSKILPSTRDYCIKALELAQLVTINILLIMLAT